MCAIVLLRGAPGVGKSTVAQHLCESARVGALVEVDDVRHMFTDVDWGNRQQHAAALRAATLAAMELTRTGNRPCLLVDCFGRGTAPQTVNILESMGASVATVSLWASPEVLQERLRRRDGPGSDAELALAMNEEVRASRVSDVLVDTTHRTAVEAAATVWAHVEERLCL